MGGQQTWHGGSQFQLFLVSMFSVDLVRDMGNSLQIESGERHAGVPNFLWSMVDLVRDIGELTRFPINKTWDLLVFAMSMRETMHLDRAESKTTDQSGGRRGSKVHWMVDSFATGYDCWGP